MQRHFFTSAIKFYVMVINLEAGLLFVFVFFYVGKGNYRVSYRRFKGIPEVGKHLGENGARFALHFNSNDLFRSYFSASLEVRKMGCEAAFFSIKRPPSVIGSQYGFTINPKFKRISYLTSTIIKTWGI